MIFLIGTGNKGKRKEFLALLNPHPCYFLSKNGFEKPASLGEGLDTQAQDFLPEIDKHSVKNRLEYKAPEETGSSFEENARLKARALKEFLKKNLSLAERQEPSSGPRRVSPATQCELGMGEDSGLEVLALGGAPGIYSARYAGHIPTDKENVDLLLHNMAHIPEERRQAVFVSHIVALALDSAQEYSVEGRLEGQIALAPRGQKGFGYDPVFIPKGETQTMAELGETYKNRFSHRARAVQKLLQTLNLSDKLKQL